MVEPLIGLIELGIGLKKLGIGLIELGIVLKIDNARRTVLARVSRLVIWTAERENSSAVNTLISSLHLNPLVMVPVSILSLCLHRVIVYLVIHLVCF